MTPDATPRTGPIARTALWAALLTLALPLSPAAAQDADAPGVAELVAKNLAARGGAEKIRAVDSARFHGTLRLGEDGGSNTGSSNGGGSDAGEPEGQRGSVDGASFTLEWQRPNHVRLEMDMEGMEMVQGYDGEVGWQMMPMLGPEPRRMTEQEAQTVERMAGVAFEGLLLDWQKRGRKVESLGAAEVEGEPAYKLRVTDETGHVTDLYLDADSYLERRLEEEQEQPGGAIKVITDLDQYRDVDGLLLPFRVEQQAEGAPAGQRFEIEKIELGVELPEDRFTMPESESEGGSY